MQSSWYSNGKLMITGEYTVLSGAKALAIPLKFGQSLTIGEGINSNQISFKTYLSNNEWFSALYNASSLKLISSTSSNRAAYINKLLLAAKQLNSNFIKQNESLQFVAEMNFNPDWGLGSSSSLISNIAYCANVDPYKLNEIISNGSGYDIACARSNSPLIYANFNNTVEIHKISLYPEITSHIWFIYLGKKQNTDKEIINFFKNEKPTQSDINSISDISFAFTQAKNISDARQLIDTHENITSKIIHQTPIKKKHFEDFEGSIKSLGAWGGDFCMAITDYDEQYIKNYFEQKGLATVFKYNDIVLKK